MNLRSFRPAYLFNRLRQWQFEKTRPDAPWLAESAVLLLESYLRPTDVGFEWGAGRSTLWLARRVAHLYSVEERESWYRTVQGRLEQEGLLSKVTSWLIPCAWGEMDEPPDDPYAAAVTALPDRSLDFALVDGNIRLTCMRAVLPKLAPGGLLILDNANRFLPNHYPDGPATVHEPRAKPYSDRWAQLLEDLKGWRSIHTTDRIWDTRFWIKPL